MLLYRLRRYTCYTGIARDDFHKITSTTLNGVAIGIEKVETKMYVVDGEIKESCIQLCDNHADKTHVVADHSAEASRTEMDKRKRCIVSKDNTIFQWVKYGILYQITINRDNTVEYKISDDNYDYRYLFKNGKNIYTTLCLFSPDPVAFGYLYRLQYDDKQFINLFNDECDIIKDYTCDNVWNITYCNNKNQLNVNIKNNIITKIAIYYVSRLGNIKYYIRAG